MWATLQSNRRSGSRLTRGADSDSKLTEPGASNYHLEVCDLTKTYGDQNAVTGVTIRVEQGRFVTLLGPSGSGKTTVLMAIAGFVAPTSGEVLLSGRAITGLPPEQRNFGMVFQGYALFPNMTVEENVWFPLRVRGQPLAAARSAVEKILDLMQMGPFKKRLPRELSGGQQQRVALARALIFAPELLLLDEPLSALDKQLRADLQWELKSLHRRLGSTFINVTHDQDEALSLSDEIVILRNGRVEQVGTPSNLYAQPATTFVASFLGESNFLRGRVVFLDADRFRYAVGDRTFVQAGTPPNCSPGSDVIIALRPERIDVSRHVTDSPNAVPGRVADFRYHGSNFLVQIDTDFASTILVRTSAARMDFTPEPGTSVYLSWPPGMGVPVREA
jgi:putative spermidine/putrescine transport system ATP-binding protein